MNRKSNKHFVVFDLETEMIPRHAMGKKVHHSTKTREIKKLKIKCACAYVSKNRKYVFYNESSISRLIELLRNTPVIIGYNILGFDLPVLEKYGADHLLKKKSVDLCKEISFVLPYRQRAKLVTVGKSLLRMEHTYKQKRNDRRQTRSIYETTPKELLNICKRDVQITKKLYRFWLIKSKSDFKSEVNLALSNVIYAREMSKIPTYQAWRKYLKWKYNKWEGNYDRFRSWDAKTNWEDENCASHNIKPTDCIYCKKGILQIIRLKDISPEKIKSISRDFQGSILSSRLIRMSYGEFIKYKNGHWRPVCCTNCNKITLSDPKWPRRSEVSKT